MRTLPVASTKPPGMAPSGHYRWVKCTPVTVGSKLCAGSCHWCQFMGTHARRSVQGDTAKVERLDQYSAGVGISFSSLPGTTGVTVHPPKGCLYLPNKVSAGIVDIVILDWTALRRHPLQTRDHPSNGCNSLTSMSVLSPSGRRDRIFKLVGTAALEDFFFFLSAGLRPRSGLSAGFFARIGWHKMRSRVPCVHPCSRRELALEVFLFTSSPNERRSFVHTLEGGV